MSAKVKLRVTRTDRSKRAGQRAVSQSGCVDGSHGLRHPSRCDSAQTLDSRRTQDRRFETHYEPNTMSLVSIATDVCALDAAARALWVMSAAKSSFAVGVGQWQVAEVQRRR
jgi:hypothetical protein